MDSKTLVQTLQTADLQAMDWKFALYSKRRGKDGQELEWYLCRMQDAATQAGRIIEYLLKKPVSDKPVLPYSPFVSDKESIGALARDNDIIRDQLEEVVMSIQRGGYFSPEDFYTGVLPKPVGYALLGELDADAAEPRIDTETGEVTEFPAVGQLLLMRRGNPFISGSVAKLYEAQGDDIISCDSPILRLAAGADFVMGGDACYIFSSAIEKDFEMENRHLALAAKCMEMLEGEGIVSDFFQLELAAMKPKNARKFMDFDEKILEHILRLPIAQREDFLITYGVTVDHEGKIDSSDPEQCELIIDLLCCRSCLDPLGRLSVGNNITPRD